MSAGESYQPAASPRMTEPDMFPEPYPWCLTCGFQHAADEHCPECNGDHSPGHCVTPEVLAELANVAGLRSQVEAAAPLVARVARRCGR